jgi:uncharacterized protein GlcG (DUF336 family)
MAIALTEALRAIEAAHRKAEELGVRVTAAVVDPAGLLIALGRMDGSMGLSPQIAEGKAVAASLLQRDGDAVASMNEQRPAFFQAVSSMARVTLVPGLGSLLVRRDGLAEGAIGVSGAKPEQDLECAQAALSAIG